MGELTKKKCVTFSLKGSSAALHNYHQVHKSEPKPKYECYVFQTPPGKKSVLLRIDRI